MPGRNYPISGGLGRVQTGGTILSYIGCTRINRPLDLVEDPDVICLLASGAAHRGALSQTRLPQCFPLATRGSSRLSIQLLSDLRSHSRTWSWLHMHQTCVSGLFIQLSDSPSLRSLVLPRCAFLSISFHALSTCVLYWIVFSDCDCLLPALISCLSLNSELSCLHCCVCWWLTLSFLPHFQ